MTRKGLVIAATAVAALLQGAPVWACATCFGAADDPQTKGMNMAIFTLMFVTYGLFLGMITAAFLIWRRNRRKAAVAEGEESDADQTSQRAVAREPEISHG